MVRPIKNLAGSIATGDGTHFGTNDLDQINNLFTGQDQSATDPVTINTTTTFGAGKLLGGNFPYTYIIYKSGSNFIADSGQGISPSTSTSNSDFATLFNNVISGINPAGTPTRIQLGAGDFPINNLISIPPSTIGNIEVRGMGMGVTNLLMSTGLNSQGANDAIKVGALTVSSSGNTGTLTANANIKATTVTMSTADSAKFAVDDYVLLEHTGIYSAAPSGGARQGEVHRVTAVNTGTGVVTLNTPILANYTTANTALLIKLTLLTNVKFAHLTIKKDVGNLTSSTIQFFTAYHVNNMQLDCVQLIDSVANFYSALTYQSCINSSITNCYILQNAANASNQQYGIALTSHCTNIIVDHCKAYGSWRHPFEVTGRTSVSDPCTAGQGRNVTISNCLSIGSNTGSFDTHADADQVRFENCAVLGTTGGNGFELRSARPVVSNCTVNAAVTRGFDLLEDASDAQIISCSASNCGNEGLRIQTNVKRVKVIGGSYNNNSNDGINVAIGADYTVISGVNANNNTFNGIKIIDTDHVNINGCLTTGNTLHGIYVNAPTLTLSNVSVSNNDTTGNTLSGILLDPNVTGSSSTFLGNGLLLRNPANTFTSTIVNPAVTANSTLQFNAPYDYYIFIDPDDSSKIKCRSGRTGAIESSHATNADVPIQYALNQLTSGGSIFIGIGSFPITSPITSSHGINIVGSGRGNTTLLHTMTTAAALISLIGDNSILARLTVDGNFPTNSTAVSAEISTSGTNVIITDCEVKNFLTRGVANSGKITLANSIIGPTTGTATGSTPGGFWSGSLTAWNKIENCRFEGINGGAMLYTGYTIISGCIFGNNNNASFGGGQLAASTNGVVTIIENNIIYPGAVAGATGLEVNNGDHFVRGNWINGQASAGIAVNPSVPIGNTVISDNVISGCGTSGIQFIAGGSGQQYFQIKNNNCKGNGHYGIEIGVAAHNNYTITGNILYGNTLGQLLDNGTGTSKTVINNIGYNPVTQSAITVTTSPFTYTNIDGYPEVVTVIGGTVSLIQLKRGATTITLFTSTPGSVYLQQNDAVVVTYSSAPTMEKFPQ